MSADAWIIDGYVDEPACLGVPPYLSPYVRTVAGVLTEHGYYARYCTIDQVRVDPGFFSHFLKSGIVVMIAGVTVPGNYIGGTPATLTEIQQIGLQLKGPEKFIGGPIGFGYSPGGGEKAVLQAIAGFDHLLTGSPAEALDSWFTRGVAEADTNYSRSDVWSVIGSPIIREHPSFPFLMCEIETARGCARAETGGCSFCTEPLYGPPVYRTPGGIIREIEALFLAGARHFRIGRQPDLLAYQAPGGEYPIPQVDILRDLFLGIREAAPGLGTLHIDNINPGTIARHPEESREALEVIVRYHTPGDVAALGMETADPVVVRENNLKAEPREVMEAIRIVNEVGAKRNCGIPELLPGLNFVSGLPGETPGTYELNESFLLGILEKNLLVRRVNLRQLMAFPGTRAYENNTIGLYDSRFRKFKEFVRGKFDRPMIEQVFPVGTVFRNVIVEISGALSFGRQMGTYPVLVGIPLVLPPRTVIDAAVVAYGSRSLTALPIPIDINHLPHSALKWLPGVGKKKVATIAAGRPYQSLEEFRKVAGVGTLDSTMIFSR
ncbi:MAG TPA: radical SAM protein [Methanoregulaceae archaeon]|nr:radical SAM protein [Methanoregulaceae archaeon]